MARVLAQPALRLVGLHCHLGSQITGVASFELATHRMTGLLADCTRRHGIVLTELDLGGGHAIPYQAGAREFDLPGFAHRVRNAFNLECSRHGIPRPRLTVEPGRAIVGRAGVTMYRVAVPCSGTYHHSMASNYNLVGRPLVVALADGQADLLVRRETEEDLLRRDVG